MKNSGFVLDTNVLISAALSSGGAPAQVTRWVVGQGRLVFSDETFSELETRLWRPKFDRYLSIEDRNAILHDLGAIADLVDIAGVTAPVACRDPDDETIVRTAIAGRADWVVSGDGDLLTLPPIKGLTILSPQDMLTRIKALH